MKAIRHFLGNVGLGMKDERGAAAVEYSIIAGMIALVIVASIGLLGGGVSAFFNTVAGFFS